jgi:hypothetical protein
VAKQTFPLLIPLNTSYIPFSTIRMMTSEITNEDRKTEVVAIVVDRLSDPRDAKNVV